MDWDAISRTLVEHLAPPVLTILAGVLGVLGTVALRRLQQWLGVQRTESLQRTWDALVDDGIAYARQRAKRYANGRTGGGKAPSSQKLVWALEWVTARAREHELPELARERLEQLIEARLGRPDSPD